MELIELKTNQNFLNEGLEGGGYKALVLGRTGTGKSSLCNAIVGYQAFVESSDTDIMWTRTTSYKRSRLEPQSNNLLGEEVWTVIDTPDLSELDKTPNDKFAEVQKWYKLASTRKSAILYTIRADRPFQPEDYAIYAEVKQLWEQVSRKFQKKWLWKKPCGSTSFTDRLVLVFTYWEKMEKPVEEMVNGGHENAELKKALKDADGLYYVFNKKLVESSSTSVAEELEALIYQKEMVTLRKSRKLPKGCFGCCLSFVGLLLLLLLGLVVFS